MSLRKLLGLFLAATIYLAITGRAAENEPAAPMAAENAKQAPLKKKKIIKAAPVKNKSVPIDQVAPAPSKPKQRDSVMSWLKDLKKRVAKSQARQNQIVAVAAVRGNEAPDSPPLYWKGKKTAGNVEMPELKQFEEAIDSALSGNSDDSIQKLQALVTAYPESPLIGEAQETLRKLQEPAAQ